MNPKVIVVWKRTFYIFVILCLMGITLLSIPLYKIYVQNEPDTLSSYSQKNFGIVFGASVYPGEKLSPTLKARVDDAIYLYKEKKIRKIVFSGSVYNQMRPGEPQAMKNYALKNGVSAKDIILDERGDRTYATVNFALWLSRLHPGNSFVFISSAYHIPRIRFLVKEAQIPNSYFFFRSTKKIPFYRREVLRELLAYWFYVCYKLIYD